MRKLFRCLGSILLAVLPIFAEMASALNKTKDDGLILIQQVVGQLARNSALGAEEREKTVYSDR